MEKEKLIEMTSISEMQDQKERNKSLSSDLKKAVFKDYHSENLNVKYMALAGMFIFPILNIFACHTGLLELAKLVNWNYIFCYIIAATIPLLLEAAQYATLAPFMKKLAHKKTIHNISWLNFSFFSIALFLLSGYGIFKMASINTDFKTALAIGYILSLFFVGMTIYSHHTYQGFLFHSLDEAISLTKNIHISDIIKTKRIKEVWMNLAVDYISDNQQSLSLPIAETKAEISDNKNKIGFHAINQAVNDNRFKTKRCETCNKEYAPKREASRFCSLTCRQSYHNNERKIK